MLKTLIIITLILYVLYKMGVFRAFVSGYSEPTSQNRQPHSKVKVESAPQKEKRKPFKGGDYVDYEEIK